MIFGAITKVIKDAKITRRQSLTTVICSKTVVAVLYESYMRCDKIAYYKKTELCQLEILNLILK